MGDVALAALFVSSAIVIWRGVDAYMEWSRVRDGVHMAIGNATTAAREAAQQARSGQEALATLESRVQSMEDQQDAVRAKLGLRLKRSQ